MRFPAGLSKLNGVRRPATQLRHWRSLGWVLPILASFGGMSSSWFEGQAATALEPVISDLGRPARAVSWTDGNGLQRSAIMVDQTSSGAGFLRQLTYRFDGVERVCRGTGDNGHEGDGYVQNHTASGGDSSSHHTPGTTSVLLSGPHHAILAYEMPTYTISGKVVPTTVHWFFADGRSHPVFTLTQDARNSSGNLGADCRSPYGDVGYDGGIGAPAGGAAFGDTFKFVTLASNPEQVTRASGWRYDEPNTIPYAMQWADPAVADAEMGHVGTVPISVRDQGSDPRSFPASSLRGHQQVNGPMIEDDDWAYQILNYILPTDGSPTSSKRLAWGTNWGLPGGFDNYGDKSLDPTEYSEHSTSLNGSYNGHRRNGLLLTYSVFVVLGGHGGKVNTGSVGQTVTDMENSALAQLRADVGTVRSSGPAGVGSAKDTAMTYTPAGYNPTYATWELVADANRVDATLTPAAGRPLDHPILVVGEYAADEVPVSLILDGKAGLEDVDYFITADRVNQRLWITINRVLGTSARVQIGSREPARPPTIINVPTSGEVGTSIRIQGSDFVGVTAVVFNGVNANFTIDSPTQITAVIPAAAGPGFVSIVTPAGTALSPQPFHPTPVGGPEIGAIAGTFRQLDTDGGGWFTGFAIHSTGRLYGRTDVGGLYRSDDHGDRWTFLSGGMRTYSGHCVQGVAVSSGNADVVYQCVGVSYAGADQGIWKSSDGGATWIRVKDGLRFSGNDPERWGGECIALRPGKDDEVWAGTRGDGLWRSLDGGLTWSKLGTSVFGTAQFTSVCLPPAGRADIWVGASGFSGPGGVWVSVNDGASWTFLR